MRSIIMATIAGVALAFGAVAQAATFSGSYSVDYNNSDPGLVVDVSPQHGVFSFDMEPHSHYKMPLFHIWTDEGYVNRDDKRKKDIEVSFDFDTPEGDFSIGGHSYGGSSLWGVVQYGAVYWDEPMTWTMKDGGILTVGLTREKFNYGLFGTSPGYKHGATVYAKFQYKSGGGGDPAPVPLPGALVLMLTGLGALGFAGWRRRQTAAA